MTKFISPNSDCNPPEPIYPRSSIKDMYEDEICEAYDLLCYLRLGIDIDMSEDEFWKKWELLCEKWDEEIEPKANNLEVFRNREYREELIKAVRKIKEEMAALQMEWRFNKEKKRWICITRFIDLTKLY